MSERAGAQLQFIVQCALPGMKRLDDTESQRFVR